MLTENNSAPLDITLDASDGTQKSLRDFLGSFTVVYFYPKDDTPGCTVEACELRDYNAVIEKLGVKIVGISKDPIKSHLKFIDKYKLPFILLSDPETKLMQAFGTWMEKKFMGKSYMGTARATFILDKDGTIIKAWPAVTPLGHGKEVYEFLKQKLA